MYEDRRTSLQYDFAIKQTYDPHLQQSVSPTNMDLDEQMLTEIEQIQKSNQILNNLEVKLGQYMSKSKLVTQRPPTAMTFLMPSLDPKTSTRSIEDSDHKSANNSRSQINTSISQLNQTYKPSQKQFFGSFGSGTRNLNLVDEQIKVYKDKIEVRRESSEKRFEELYEHKARKLQEEIEELSQRREKIRNDRELLGKENRRLMEVLKRKESEHSRFAEKQKQEEQRALSEKSEATELKKKNVVMNIQKQKLLGRELEKELKDLEYEIKLLDEKAMVVIGQQTQKVSLSRSRSKSKKRAMKMKINSKSKSSTSKKYPTEKASSKSIVLKMSKSKSTLSRKFQ